MLRRYKVLVSVQVGEEDLYKCGNRLKDSPLPNAVRYSNTSRPCCLKLIIAVSILSTNRLPLSLFVPNDFLRRSTARRSARSALLLVGSMPSTSTNLHKLLLSCNILSQVCLVFLW